MNFIDSLAERIIQARIDQHVPMFVAICGWADTGKSTLAAELCRALRTHEVSADWISTDAFMKDRTDRNKLGISGYNPLSIDADELALAISKMASGQTYTYFPYDNRTGTKEPVPRSIAAEPVIVIEGIHAFHPAIPRRRCLRIFIHSDEATLRTMRARANVGKRGMDEVEAWKRIDSELEDFRNFVMPGRDSADIRVAVSAQFDYAIEDGSL
jgi:uridine kinase